MAPTTASRRRFITALASAAALSTVLSACSLEAEHGGKDGLDTLKVSTIGLTSDGSLVEGMDKGYFADEGLEIETSLVKDPPSGLAAAQSGQVDVAYSPSISILTALSKGMSLKVIAGADGFSSNDVDSGHPEDFDDTALYAAPKSGIKSIKDLKGKKIAVPARKAQLEVTVTEALKEAKVDPGSVDWVVLDFTSAVESLKQGKVDAAAVVSPFDQSAEEAGAHHLLAPSLNFFGPRAVGMWTVGGGTYSEKRDLIERFTRAINRSNSYANEHTDDAIEAGLKYTKSDLTLDEVKKPYWPESIAEDDLSAINDKLVKLKVLDGPVDLKDVVIEGDGK